MGETCRKGERRGREGSGEGRRGEGEEVILVCALLNSTLQGQLFSLVYQLMLMLLMDITLLRY